MSYDSEIALGAAESAAASAVTAANAAEEAVTLSGISTADGVVETLIQDTGSDTAAALAAYIEAFTPPLGAVVTAADNVAAIQAKADACETDGTTLGIPAGLWDLGSTTVTFHCSVRADPEAVFTGDGNPVVKVGDGSTNLVRATLLLPKVTRKTKNWGVAPGPGAGTINSDVGVRVDDTRSCTIWFPHVQNFSIGINLADDNGSLYNRYMIGHLDNNGINLRAAATGAGGCANECQIHGGRYSHDSGEGSNVTGVRHIALLPGSAAGPNNMLFFGGSIEGNTPEYHVECQGSYNLFQSVRWEAATPKFLAKSAGAYNNMILGGYGVDEVVVSTATSGAPPTVIGYTGVKNIFGGADGGYIMRPGSSNAHPAWIILQSTEDPNGTGGNAPSARYSVKATSQQITGKFAPGDAHPSMDVQFVNGKIGFGDGASAITQFVRQETGTQLGFMGTGICATTDATYDIGASGARRFRDQFLSRDMKAGGVVATGSGATGSRPGAGASDVGAMWFDTTLGKPIWSTGAAWVDATGATV